MNSILRSVELYEKGLIEAVHVAEDAVERMAEEQSLRLYEALPEGLQEAVIDKLKELRECDFDWVPFVFGPGYSKEEAAELRAQLRSIYNMMMEDN